MYTRVVRVPATLRRLPVVLLSCYTRGKRLTTVVPDETDAGRMVARELLRHGHRDRIVLVGERTAQAIAGQDRLAGIREVLVAEGTDLAGVVDCPWWPDDASNTRLMKYKGTTTTWPGFGHDKLRRPGDRRLQIYFAVEDTDVMMEAARPAGGGVMVEPIESPWAASRSSPTRTAPASPDRAEFNGPGKQRLRACSERRSAAASSGLGSPHPPIRRWPREALLTTLRPSICTSSASPRRRSRAARGRTPWAGAAVPRPCPP